MSESGDFNPVEWKGKTFKEEKKKYDEHVGRSYTEAVEKGKTTASVLESRLETKCHMPLVMVFDVTGSMGEWPATIFSKLGYLDVEGKNYLGKDMEICFAAVGDAYGDSYPLQVRNFGKGAPLEQKLKELIIEGGGGAGYCETYELAALYFARNCSMPKDAKPLLIFVGDEAPYDYVASDHAKKYCGQALQGRLTTKAVIEELKAKFDVYIVRRNYGPSEKNTMNSTDQEIHDTWTALLGPKNVKLLPEPDRILDVVFGIMGLHTDKVDYFRQEIEGRQRPDQVASAYEALGLHPDIKAKVKPAEEAPEKGDVKKDPATKKTTAGTKSLK